MSMHSIESHCLKQVHKYLSGNSSAETRKKLFKTVNSMLQVLDKDGLYGAVVYLQVYGKDDLALLGHLNRILNTLYQNKLEERVNERTIAEVKKGYAGHFCDDSPQARTAEMLLRRFLIHLRYAAKAQDKERT